MAKAKGFCAAGRSNTGTKLAPLTFFNSTDGVAAAAHIRPKASGQMATAKGFNAAGPFINGTKLAALICTTAQTV
jgi:hypothetical protein